MMTVFQAFSQIERNLIVERTKEELKKCESKRKKRWSPRVNQRAMQRALKLYESQEYCGKEVEKMTGILLRCKKD